MTVELATDRAGEGTTHTSDANQRRAEGLRRAQEVRRSAPKLVTADGFGPHAVVADEATGCLLWQGCMLYNQPKAVYDGRKVNPRILAYERAGRTVPPGSWLVPTCGQWRCIAPDHCEPRSRMKKPPAPPKPRPVPETPLRKELAGRLPPERPPQIREKDWLALTAVVAGRTLAEVGADLGLTRQRVHQLVERARRTLVE